MPDFVMPPVPEHEKMLAPHRRPPIGPCALNDHSQLIGEFIEWLQQDKGYAIAEWSAEVEEYEPVHRQIPELLAEYFKIDLAVIEEEKRAMLEAARAANE